MKTTRLNMLESSLQKKEARLDEAFERHFADVRQANGQPLNDKRNGQQTLSRWDRQNDQIRRQQAEVQKTKNAIEREQGKINECDNALRSMPKEILDLVEDGILKQWRKYPDIFFVDGVDKARMQYKDGILSHRYVSNIPNQEQFAKFRDVFNGLKRDLTPNPPRNQGDEQGKE